MQPASHFFDLPSWVGASLLGIFMVITLFWQLLDEWAKHRAEQKEMWPLQHTIARVKEEFLAVGIISILLTLVEPELGNNCVKEDWVLADLPYSTSYPTNGTEYWSKANPCPTGKVPLLTKKAAHAVHILIYVVVFLHVLISSLLVMTSWYRIRQWKKWEHAGRRGVKLNVSSWMLQSLGSSKAAHWIHVVVSPVSHTIRDSTYLALRRSFLENLRTVKREPRIEYNFPFLHFCQYELGTFMAKLVWLNWSLWLLAAAMLALPSPKLQLGFILGLGFTSVITLHAISLKLHSVLVHCAAKSYFQFQGELGTRAADISTRAADISTKATGTSESGARMDPLAPAEAGEVNPLTRSSTFSEHLVQYLGSVKEALPQEKLERRRARVSDTMEELFLYHRPGLLLVLLKVVVFDLSLSLAVVLSSLWGHHERFSQYGFFRYLGPMIMVVEGVLLVTSAWNVLPVYVLVMMARQDAGVRALRWLNEMKFMEEKRKLMDVYVPEKDAPEAPPPPDPEAQPIACVSECSSYVEKAPAPGSLLMDSCPDRPASSGNMDLDDLSIRIMRGSAGPSRGGPSGGPRPTVSASVLRGLPPRPSSSDGEKGGLHEGVVGGDRFIMSAIKTHTWGPGGFDGRSH